MILTEPIAIIVVLMVLFLLYYSLCIYWSALCSKQEVPLLHLFLYVFLYLNCVCPFSVSMDVSIPVTSYFGV